jgi:hypothetical protein
MKSIAALQADADRYRNAVLKTASTLSRELRPLDLLDEAVGRLDPTYKLLGRMESEAKRNPLALLAVVGGLWFFIQQVKIGRPETKSATRRARRPVRLTRALTKGDENGYNNDAERD